MPLLDESGLAVVDFSRGFSVLPVGIPILLKHWRP